MASGGRILIERQTGGCGALCAELLAELPEWFGLLESNIAYARDAETWPVWIAKRDEAAVGLMLLKPHAEALEIHLLGVRRAARRSGVGSSLIKAAEEEARRVGARFLTVKTRGPSAPEPSWAYDETRAFYRRCGFAAIEEFTEIWGRENPALLMAKAV